MLHLPPTAANLPEWIRRAAGTINELIGRLGSFGTSAAVTSSYSAADSDYLIMADAAGGAVTIALPGNRLGKQYVIKKTDSSANVVTISAAGGETIDGAASLSITAQWQSYTIMGVAGGWAVL